MKKYVICEFTNSDGEEKILISYRKITKRGKLSGVKLLAPKETKLVEIIGSYWNWKSRRFFRRDAIRFKIDKDDIELNVNDDESAILFFEMNDF